MLFHEFVQKLYPVISFGENTARFTKTILEAIVADEHLDLLDYSESSYKKFYSGNSSIHKLAAKIAAYIDPMLFTEYLNGLNLNDAPVEKICELFSEVLPDIDAFNAREKLGELLFGIITEAAGTNKKSTQTGAGDRLLVNEVLSEVRSQYQLTIEEMYKSGLSVDNRSEKSMYKSAVIYFYEYLYKAKSFYSEKKTLLYAEKPRPFYDIYVCNDLLPHVSRSKDTKEFGESAFISNATIPQLESICNHIIIEGTGGIGKSMFLTHLFLSSSNNIFNKEFDKFPVFISLKEFKETNINMNEFILSVVRSFVPNIDINHVLEILESKKIILLLDGLDEITSSFKESFDKCLETFVKAYPDITIILTSRPVKLFVSYVQFILYDIQPLNKDQALTLIDKLEFWDSAAKQSFRNALDRELFSSHYEFASNPLLLTIMLMTYSTFGEVPAKMHVFYSKAYETMARLHDASKGAFKRPLHTNITPEVFKKYFSEFCARTYADEMLEFTEQTFASYMDIIINKSMLKDKIISNDFLLDLTNNLCIMYREGEKYSFIHRSFQEYFAALYFSSVYDSKLAKIGDFFEATRKRSFTDRTFDMLYDMIPEKIERFIFFPFLKNKFAEWHSSIPDEMYWNFLEDQYQTIYYEYGDTGNLDSIKPKSFLYNFIINTKNIAFKTRLYDLDWPIEVFDMPKTEWVNAYVSFTDIKGFEKYPDPNLIPETVFEETMPYIKEDLPAQYKEYFGDLDYDGLSIEIDTFDLHQDPNNYNELKAFLSSRKFPIREEFERLKTYYSNLQSQYAKERKSISIFDD